MCETFWNSQDLKQLFVKDSFPPAAWKSTWIRHSWNCRLQEPWTPIFMASEILCFPIEFHSNRNPEQPPTFPVHCFLLLQPLRLLGSGKSWAIQIAWLVIRANFCHSKSSTCFRWIDLELLFCRRWHTSLEYLQCVHETSFWPRDLCHSSKIVGENVIMYFGFKAQKLDRISRCSILAILAMRRRKEPSRVEIKID